MAFTVFLYFYKKRYFKFHELYFYCEIHIFRFHNKLMEIAKKRKYNQQPNIITRSSDQMTLIEKRILYLVINQMESGMSLQEDLFRNLDFTISVSDTGESNYKRIREALEKLQGRKLVIIDDFKAKKFTSIVPFPYVSYDKGKIHLKMLGDVTPYFLELKYGFTKYELEAALSLNSVYSQKLYELLSRWKDKKEWSVPIEELKMLLNAEHYKRTPDFKRACIDAALNEIEEKTDLKGSYEVVKKGNKIIGFDFKIQTYKDLARESHSEEMEGYRDLTSNEKLLYTQKLLLDYNFTRKQQNEIVSNPALFNKFVDLESKIANGVITGIKNPTAYLAKSIFEYK